MLPVNSASFLSSFSAPQRDLLRPLLQACQFDSGEMIFTQGQAAGHLYVLQSGAVRVDHKPFDGPPLTVARIQPGGAFGWSAVMGSAYYTSSAVAEAPAQAFRLHAEELGRLCRHDPALAARLLSLLAGEIAQRLNSTTAQIFAILCSGFEINPDATRRMASYD